jgi:2-amino-4-hydroxy-6-hydroxymethyldihydropteridine diphosphokinase
MPTLAPPFGPSSKPPIEPFLDAVIGLGSNLQDRLSLLRFAVIRLGELGQLMATSAVYETLAVGPPQPDYLNAAVRLVTLLEPEPLLEALLEIERSVGRVRRERWGARCLDLDLLWLSNRSVNASNLVVPHPELSGRAFALAPLLDVAPEATDPRTGLAYAELFAGLDVSGIRRAYPASELFASDT